MGWRGRREAQERWDICIHMADLRCCSVGTNTTLESNYTPIKKKKGLRRAKIPTAMLDEYITF